MDVNSDMYGIDKSSFLESSYQVNDDTSIPIYADVHLYPCSNCGRSFNAESLRKHQPICKKSSQKQSRKVFDTGKQRATDSDVPYVATKETSKFYTEGTKPKQDNPKKKSSDWREDHNALVRTIREARQITRAIETGAPLPKQTPSQIPSDYVQCEFCQRNFNKHSAERHIPFCETQYKRKQMQYAAAATNNIRSAAGGGSGGRQGRGSHPQPGLETPIGSANKQHQINSAPSTLSKRSQKTNDEKDCRRPPLNPNTFKKPSFGETYTNSVNGTPPKHGNYRTTKVRSATGAHLPGMMRTGRTSENDDLNVIAATGRGQQKSDASPQPQRRTPGIKTRSPSPARRPSQGNGITQQQKVRQPVVSTAAKHCHVCGEAFPIDRAKYCCECGEKRLGV